MLQWSSELLRSGAARIPSGPDKWSDATELNYDLAHTHELVTPHCQDTPVCLTKHTGLELMERNQSKVPEQSIPQTLLQIYDCPRVVAEWYEVGFALTPFEGMKKEVLFIFIALELPCAW
ncbi:unnamed protein product [Menidia menidia]|uniref:(Atlantic silverside) hypothetical protein n=1 Tax=Menidia menidia TaxID=238744 RepID=A0A8S4BPT4_9TELE|nr:unnamed protein product [Menidia menidia]